MKQVSVSDKDHVWGVNNGDYIYRRTGNSWQQVSGRLKVVSVGQSGVWGVNSNDDIFYRTGTYGDPDTQGTGVSIVHGREPNKLGGGGLTRFLPPFAAAALPDLLQ